MAEIDINGKGEGRELEDDSIVLNSAGSYTIKIWKSPWLIPRTNLCPRRLQGFGLDIYSHDFDGE